MPSKKQVYLALSPSVGEVKIGVSTNPPGQLQELQIARPDMELLLTIPAGYRYKLERKLHQRFREFHIAGEWFRYGTEIQDFVKIEQERCAHTFMQRSGHERLKLTDLL
jgi:hypothetical protein